MISANEAFERSSTKLKEIVEKQISTIDEQIINACESGDFNVVFKGYAKMETIHALEEAGYYVRKEQEFLHISWGEDVCAEKEDDEPLDFVCDEDISLDNDVDDVDQQESSLDDGHTEEILFDEEEDLSEDSFETTETE